MLSEGKKIYFYSQIFAYVLGLVTTVVMMIQFNAAQPALLYLVPAALLSALLTAAIRGQMVPLIFFFFSCLFLPLEYCVLLVLVEGLVEVIPLVSVSSPLVVG